MDFETEEERTRLRDWISRHAGDRPGLRVVEASRMSAGHSNDTFSAVVEWDGPGGPARDAYVLRTRPEGVGLLEPYDVSKQYRIMQALAGTAVPVPRMLWFDEAGEVMGRPMFAMEKLDGVIIEAEIPDYLVNADPAKVRRMCERYIDTVAAIHLVDGQAAGLAWLEPSADLLETEIGWWDQEIRRFQHGPLPAIDVIVDWLRANRPPSSPRVALVHGDAKPGNVLYDDEMVRAMFDWEMTTLGDPLTDIGWLAWLWTGMGGLSSLPGALTKEEMLRRYEERTGISTAALHFYEVLAGFKMVAILFVGAMLFDSGKSNDL
ncbi:MAG: phosphotransferase family protein, partial [Dehalococcoidia bacterium]|nr:phosphotransferase family protein [Dehalococcoidia bacterium]